MCADASCLASSSTKCKSTATAAREERKRIAGVQVTLSWPASTDAAESPKPKGVTFLLPGANIKLSEYNGLRDVLVGERQLVVGLYVNVLWPLVANHRKHAQDVKKVFDVLVNMYSHLLLPDSYNVVGHSVGGKIALLLASVVDPKRVSAVLALDPVDLNPVEFSNEKGSNLPLGDGVDDEGQGSTGPLGMFSGDGPEDIVHVVARGSDDAGAQRTPIALTCTDGGRGIPRQHNAEAIHRLHPTTRYYRHARAGHLAYCDHGGGVVAGLLVPDIGTRDGNARAREAAHALIRGLFGPHASRCADE